MAASTPTLDSETVGPVAPATPVAPVDRTNRRLALTRMGLAGFSVVSMSGFALYAAHLASRVEDVIAPEPIAIPSKGATTPYGTGQYAGDFALPDLQGREVKLSDFLGRPVWVNVWASWCAPCRAEMPDIDAIYRETRASGLQLLMVSIGEDPSAVRRYLANTKYDLPILLDPDFLITERYRITGLPTHYFIDREGIIRDLAIGGLKPNGMRARLAKITG